mmetsp:Transcript_26503/g.59788  ORF Transcript_26503/g.59788 Transcript_26503/m.59788 type:complete len:90 (-) Transcript_26503:604-873(-)
MARVEAAQAGVDDADDDDLDAIHPPVAAGAPGASLDLSPPAAVQFGASGEGAPDSAREGRASETQAMDELVDDIDDLLAEVSNEFKSEE